MRKTDSLATLLTLAEKSSDEAARKLGLVLQQVNDAEKKLNMLVEFRDEYASRFQSGLISGMSPATYRNFQLFIAKLDDAVADQQLVVNQANMRAESTRGAWVAKEREKLTYKTLTERSSKRLAIAAEKKEQKITDDFASRQSFYKTRNK